MTTELLSGRDSREHGYVVWSSVVVLQCLAEVTVVEGSGNEYAVAGIEIQDCRHS